MTTGIPTTYRYNSMRSRLEARWAVFFDLIGWKWTYEPLDADGYIPDFLIHGDRPFFVEVGPCITQQDYHAKAEKPILAASSLGRDLLVVGVSPAAPRLSEYGWGNAIAGWFGEFFPATPSFDPELGGFSYDTLSFGSGPWSRCGHGWGIWHEFMSYGIRPCGQCRGDRSEWPTENEVADLWARAGSQVQWKPAA